MTEQPYYFFFGGGACPLSFGSTPVLCGDGGRRVQVFVGARATWLSESSFSRLYWLYFHLPPSLAVPSRPHLYPPLRPPISLAGASTAARLTVCRPPIRPPPPPPVAPARPGVPVHPEPACCRADEP